ncbi:uncharacterized protein LOC111259017 [Varroa jacobsoni]|uniref:uncharacterized protein LOC111259017 n=1 Tax=Varroa jacobsoni TaxID=62625 RepID=UPI000BF2C14D|nr:uncharacterized protein LOC111259017 [Varroa jacobsoni]
MIRGISKDKVLPLIGRLVRTKTVRPDDTTPNGTTIGSTAGANVPNLKRCLTTWDLTSLGVGSCCGTGMYLVTGMVARNLAGPGVIFSFCFAALASLLSVGNQENAVLVMGKAADNVGKRRRVIAALVCEIQSYCSRENCTAPNVSRLTERRARTILKRKICFYPEFRTCILQSE